jgi:peptidoglycan/LPS O-acetylase OafA/YrhL
VKSARSDGKAHLPALSGVRALAALMVLALHTGQNFPNPLVNNALVAHGYLGVDLFFILSGFIIAHVYLQKLVPLRPRPLCIFMWHRFVRLFPAHAAVLLGLIVLVISARSAGITLNEPRAWEFRDLPWHFLMIHAWGVTDYAGWNGPSWSVSTEWFAYLLFPAIAVAALRLPRRAALPLAFASLLIGAVIFNLAGWRLGWAWLGPPALIRVTVEFICGVLLYRAVQIDRTGLSPGLSDGLAFGSVLALCVGVFAPLDDFLLIALLAILIVGVSGPGVGVSAVFGYRPVVWLGEISYSIYLIHAPVVLVLRHGLERFAGLHASTSEIVQVAWFFGVIAVVIGAATMLC